LYGQPGAWVQRQSIATHQLARIDSELNHLQQQSILHERVGLSLLDTGNDEE
jgi:hypothetical protein